MTCKWCAFGIALVEGGGLCLEWAGHMWKSRRTQGETGDNKGGAGGRSGKVWKMTRRFGVFYVTTSEEIFCEYRRFKKLRKQVV